MAARDDSNAIEVTVNTPSPDLELVDALARLQLLARRRGVSLQLRPCEELRELLHFVGLTDVLSLEPRRQAEQRVQLGIEEVVQPGDPPA